MKSKTIKSMLLFLLISFVLVLGACGQSETAPEEPTDTETTEETQGDQQEPASKEKVIVGTNAFFAPFEFMETGKVVGFDIDLISAVLDEAGYEYEIQNNGWEALFQNVQNESVDIGASAITITDDRKQSYDFSSPYFEARQMILVPEGSDIKGYSDLNDKLIGVQNGTTGDFAAQEILGEKSTNVKKYEDAPTAIMAMLRGETDAVIADNAVVKYYITSNPDQKVVAIDDAENFESEYYGILIQKGNEQLKTDVNAALKTIMENGKFTEIYKKWMGEEPNLEALKQ
ncbi:basic amino acid ABC transporter substrate-binding protein [Bacillus sp. Marseille-P3661]|uniref:basic amino acid ABC transporter substrate-binding protein n=1 Tax=Bacillus sp. Marseille-P3661 TaxID=1936234 RepID=UPI000C82FC9C|nr:basic amino acid ABC transporter substrate-binding protein [Bacillus sp. Marseille-P3661]